MLAILYDLSLLTFYEIMLREKFEDTKGVIRGRNWKDNTMTNRYQWCHQKPSIEKGQTIL